MAMLGLIVQVSIAGSSHFGGVVQSSNYHPAAHLHRDGCLCKFTPSTASVFKKKKKKLLFSKKYLIICFLQVYDVRPLLCT
jgi:hypothetical protein